MAIIDDIYAVLGGDKGRFMGTSYGLSRDNKLGTLLQTPDLWGVDPSVWAHDPKRRDDLPAGKNLLAAIKAAIASATQTVDIATLRPFPDGHFLTAIQEGLAEAAKKNPNLVVRIVIGHYPTADHPFKAGELDEFLRTLAPPAGFTVYAAASRTATLLSWNHSKLVIVDGHTVIGGGHNMWDEGYCELAPTHDVSMSLSGGAAVVAQSFLNLIWRDIAEGSRGNDPTDYVYSRMWLGGSIYPNALPVIASSPPPSDGTTPVLAVARLGRNLGGATEQEAAASQIARITAVKLAKKSIKISQQMLNNKLISDKIHIYWDDELIAQLGAAVARGIDVSIVITQGGAEGGYDSAGVSVTAMHIRDSVAKASGKSGSELMMLCAQRLHVAPLRFFPPQDRWRPPSYEGYKWVKADGSLAVPGNHAKIYIIDDELFYVGSDNAYPIPFGEWGLQEFGFIGSTPGKLWPELASYWNSLWQYSCPDQFDWTPASLDMTSQIHRIENNSKEWVNAVVFSPAITESYDVIVSPHHGVTYKDIRKGAGNAPLPAPVSAEEFHLHRMRLMVGDKSYAVFSYQGKIRLSPDDVFGSAPVIPGYASGGRVQITIGADSSVKAEHVPYISGSAIAVPAWAVDRFGVYGVAPDGKVAEKDCIIGDWQPWTDIGAPTTALKGPIAGVSWVTGRYGLYALDEAGEVQERAWAGTTWSDWTSLGAPKGVTLKDLTAVYWNIDRYGVYGVDTRGEVYEKVFLPGGWHEWNKLSEKGDPVLAGPIAGVCWSSGRYGLYALDAHGKVWEKWWATTWSGWDSKDGPPGATLKSISAAPYDDRYYILAGITIDGDLWTRKYEGIHHWGEWVKVGRPPAGTTLDGAVGVWADYTENYFIVVRDTDHILSYYTRNGTWNRIDEM